MDGAERDGDRPPDFSVAVADGPSHRDAGGEQNQQQQQRQVIRWERFLPRRSLRVLLVEHDDSTRHIVTALLRKCSYHVAAVADGLKAWDVMKEKLYRFDLVLTEVEMPSLSGIGLLSKIMGCEPSKNIPVIMMSSHDSVSVVYKCMLKGAVDFLVKPVRRNELRNLWQHVWRKHCSMSFAHGPESVNNNTIKSGEMSDNNAVSNHVGANAHSRSKNKERCDDGTDTQSSGSKPEREIQSAERHREPNPTELRSSSMVMELKSEKVHNPILVSSSDTKRHDTGTEGNNIVEIEEKATSTDTCQEQHCLCPGASHMTRHLVKKDDINDDSRSLGTVAHNFLKSKPSNHNINFIGAIANGKCSHEILEEDNHMKEQKLHNMESCHAANISTSDALPSCELSVRGSHPNGFSKPAAQEKHVLKHSSASAFSRYSTGVHSACQKSESSPTTISVTIKEHCDKIQSYACNQNMQKEEMSVSPSWRLISSEGNEAKDGINQHQTSSVHNKDDGHFAAGSSRGVFTSHPFAEDGNKNVNFPSCQPGLVSHPFPVRGMPFQNICAGYGAMMQPMFYHESSVNGSGGNKRGEDSRHLDLGHHVSHIAYNLPSTVLQQCKEGPHPCSLEERKDRIVDEYGDPRAVLWPDTAQTNRNCSLGQNIHNGGGEMTETTVNAGAVTENVNEGLQGHDMKGLNGDRSRREAALMKFRLKRKDRCFEKKVRYHSRKKLAEQRPRIKGQFVRQTAIERTQDD